MNKMKFETPNLTAENVAKIAELFPGVVTEGKVNIDLLRTILGDEVFGDEALCVYLGGQACRYCGGRQTDTQDAPSLQGGKP